MEHLDAMTPVYLGRLKHRLSLNDRRILAVLCGIDRPARLSEIAALARRERSVVATYLTRLLRGGFIRAHGVRPRRRYEMADPVMGAWWWMRYRSPGGGAPLPGRHLRAVWRAVRAEAA